jgi:hypothetical protein
VEKRDDREHGRKEGTLGKRLKGVRKRKAAIRSRAQSRLGCDVIAFKMQLVNTKGQLDN